MVRSGQRRTVQKFVAWGFLRRPSLQRLTASISLGVAIPPGLVALESTARAHAPPEINQILWSPREQGVTLITNRGLIFGDPASGDWSMMCSLALGIPLEAHADFAFLPDGRLLSASSSGLQVTDNRGCDWKPVPPFADVATPALAQDASEPNTLYLSVVGPGRSGIHHSRDGGATWTRLWALADGELVARILPAPSQPTRIYAHVSSSDRDARTPDVARSSDAGRSWERFPLPLRTGEREAILLSVSPLDPDVLLVLVLHSERGVERDRVLLSRDGGASFEELWSDLELADADFGHDGKLVWIAGSYGLWRSNAAMTEVSPVGSAQLMTCVQARGDALYACGHHSGFDPAGAGVGISRDGGETFERLLAFPQVDATVTCAESSSTPSLCEELWQDWKLEILDGLTTPEAEPASAPESGPVDSEKPGESDAGPAQRDAGRAGRTADASTAKSDAGERGPEQTRSSSSGGCSSSAANAPLEPRSLAWIVALLLSARAPRSKRSPRPRAE